MKHLLESTSYFIYALASRPDAFQIMLGRGPLLNWHYSKSELPYSKYPGTAYLITAEYGPGSDKLSFVSSVKINTEEMSKAYNDGNTSLLSKMMESVDIPIDRNANLFSNVDIWMQPGAVPPSHFNVSKIPSFYGQGWSLEQYIRKFLSESTNEPPYIPPRKGTSCETDNLEYLYRGGPEGTTNGSGLIPLGEDLEEELEVVERGAFWIPLWVFLYEENAGASLLVDLDPDDSEYHKTFELPSGLRVSSDETQEIEKGRIHQIKGHNLHIFAKLLDELSKLGNPGHTYSYTINKNSQESRPAFKGQFDGDGGDYIYRISYISKNIKTK